MKSTLIVPYHVLQVIGGEAELAGRLHEALLYNMLKKAFGTALNGFALHSADAYCNRRRAGHQEQVTKSRLLTISPVL